MAEMRIKVTDAGGSTVFDKVGDACLYLMEKYRTTTDRLMGKPCMANLLTYTDRAKVEKVDHSVHWVDVQPAEEKTS